MPSGRYVWLLVPVAALAELAAHFYFAGRAPRVADWRAAKSTLTALDKPGDLVVVAPHWADPLGRLAFGQTLMPIRNEARPDDSAYARAVEVSILGERAPELSGWRTVETRREGKFTFRVLENPTPAKVLYNFVDHIDPAAVQVFTEQGSREQPCSWNPHARRDDGGLLGHLAYPERRFQCLLGESYFVGVTIIDDQNYRPRRCIWAHPGAGGPVVLRFSNVPLGKWIYGYGGLSWFLTRDGQGAPVTITVLVNGHSIGSAVHRDLDGWSRFALPTGAAGKTADVEFRVSSQGGADRHFCFYADSR
jgi:hypothetical protein